MILVTGATGCIGRAVVERLVSSGHQVKCLWHWEREHRVPLRVSIAGGDLRNQDSLFDAMSDDGVDTVVHVAGLRRESGDDTFDAIHIQGTRNVVEAMKRAKLIRLITVGSLGAEGRSPYPLLRSLGKAEEVVRSSGLNFTVFKSAVVYGEGDWLTAWLAGLAKNVPMVMPIPHSGETKLQPIWVGDLAACIDRSLTLRQTYRHILSVGGPQSLTLADIALLASKATGKQRRIVRVPSSLTRRVFAMLASFKHALNAEELDALGYNRTTEISSVHRVFGFAPARMGTRLAHIAPGWQPAPPTVQFRPQPRWNLREQLRAYYSATRSS